MDLVNRLVTGASKSKPTPICPFLYHLYKSQGLLMEEEEIDYRVAQELTWYRITLDPDWDTELDRESEEVEAITAASSSARELGEAGEEAQADVPGTGRVSTSPVEGRRKLTSTEKSKTGEATTRSSTGAIATRMTKGRGGGEAMGSQTLHCCRCKLQTGKGSVLDPGADPRVHQPLLGREAPPSPGAHPSAPEAPGFD